MTKLSLKELIRELVTQKQELLSLLEREHVGVFPAHLAPLFALEARERFQQWEREIDAIDRVLHRLAA